MRFYLLLLTIFFIPLMAGEYEEILSDFEKGKYQPFLEEYHFLYQSWLGQGKFDIYMADRRNNLDKLVIQLRAQQEKNRKSLKGAIQIDREKNQFLAKAIQNSPDLPISKMVEQIIVYNTLAIEHHAALEFIALLEIGGVDVRNDPVGLYIQNMTYEYALKGILIQSNLLDRLIDLKTADLYSLVLALEKEKKLREFCEKNRDSATAKYYLEVYLVNRAKMPIAWNQKFLADLLEGLRGPENEVESAVKNIIKAAHLKKLELQK